jgi:hypothetical protein
VLVSEQPILFEIGSIVAIPSKKHPAFFKHSSIKENIYLLKYRSQNAHNDIY